MAFKITSLEEDLQAIGLIAKDSGAEEDLEEGYKGRHGEQSREYPSDEPVGMAVGSAKFHRKRGDLEGKAGYHKFAGKAYQARSAQSQGHNPESKDYAASIKDADKTAAEVKASKRKRGSEQREVAKVLRRHQRQLRRSRRSFMKRTGKKAPVASFRDFPGSMGDRNKES